MKALNLILITSGKISEATAHIWVVSISGDNTSRVYCKSPYKAMRSAFRQSAWGYQEHLR